MEQHIYEAYLALLERELIPATGCTEPIAIAYAGAVARNYLCTLPEKVEVFCSGNLVKNVKSVVVPNSGGLRGINIAALLGLVGGDADAGLSVIQQISDEERTTAQDLLAAGICTSRLVEGTANLFLRLRAEAAGHTVEVEISDSHLNITLLQVDGHILFQRAPAADGQKTVPEPSLLELQTILAFAESADLSRIAPVLRRQANYNSAISQEGLHGKWGAQVGRTLLEHGNSLSILARAAAAAASDARMNGCPMPVVINSGSGNQGITVSVPVVFYARELGVSEERMLRALALGNLVALYQKQCIGSLSAYCGAVCAAAGAAAAIVWMRGGGAQTVEDTIVNTVATVGGMVCDGAKSSCAGKISVALAAALDAMELAEKGLVYQPGEGLVKQSAGETVSAVGRMARKGMRATDVEILHIMLEE